MFLSHYIICHHHNYNQDLIEINKRARALQSSASISLKTPIPPNSFIGRAFSFNAPKIWNNVFHGPRSCTSLQSFKKCLKTEIFKSYFIQCLKMSLFYAPQFLLYCRQLALNFENKSLPYVCMH